MLTEASNVIENVPWLYASGAVSEIEYEASDHSLSLKDVWKLTSFFFVLGGEEIGGGGAKICEWSQDPRPLDEGREEDLRGKEGRRRVEICYSILFSNPHCFPRRVGRPFKPLAGHFLHMF